MKINPVLKSTDRVLFGVTIRQQAKTQLLCVSDLQRSYDSARWQYGWSNRKITEITRGVDFKERVYYILKELNLIKMEISTFMQMIENEGVVKSLKGLGVWQTKGRGSNKSTYCNPYIWMLLAMELNPMIYAKVVVWLTDTLIMNRVLACDDYKPMNKAISSIVTNPNYPLYAKSMNNKVFGRHEKGIRNIASSEELERISKVERFVTDAINIGFIKSEDDVLKVIFEYKFTKSA